MEIASEYPLSVDQISKLQALLDFLASISDRNLTAVTSERKIVDFHFRDSLSLIGFEEFAGAQNIVDIGSGAGFPGLPLAIACPDKSFSLLEASSKKCDFIDEAIELLEIDNVKTIRARAEEAALGEQRDRFDLAIARAVGPLAVVIEYVLPLVKPAGAVLLQRGAREEGDESTASAVAGQLGGRLDRIESVHPYPDSKNLHVWVLTKLIRTPDRFPRRPGMAKKRPLA
ncbi:MAG: 16S rRNA (guanine(527)-N(7))-methyltransferase RsmG [Actinobacteria bacterium]|nr:16S rRNA (guanine(527)-N(7))-methyltransferase RsmG [Actinomycetota bacterium]